MKPRTSRSWPPVPLCLAFVLSWGCGGQGSDSGPPDSAANLERREIGPDSLARAALESAGIPLYPGSRGLDATEFAKNEVPFITVDFFSLREPAEVVAFYDRELKDLTKRRDAGVEKGAVRYEFDRAFSGLVVKRWDPEGVDSLALLARFDRRDAQGVTTADLDAYGNFLTKARTHVVVNVPRPSVGSTSQRRTEVAVRGATIMPFDLDRTRHEFRPVPDGGIQTVVVCDPADAEQVALVRMHLREAAARLGRGDFSDPIFIHGAGMPGVAELRAGARRIGIDYESLPAGARIRYTSGDPALVQAIHRWFEAQTSDHGPHAHR